MNWFKKTGQNIQQVRFRSTFPIDVFIESSGNLDADKDKAYDIIVRSLDAGFSQTYGEHAGYNYNISPSDIKTDSEV